jgi:DNA-directed RNA polymerase specialized sigma24 family protein
MSILETVLLSLQAATGNEDRDSGANPDLWLYRERTIALLRRFLHFSLETGRLPSLLGRQFFRAKVTSYRMVTFEDAVIFVHDVERCLEYLDEFSQQLIARITLQEYTREEAAVLLHCCSKTIQRAYPEALDRLSEIFLAVGILRPLIGAEKRLSSPRATSKVH